MEPITGLTPDLAPAELEEVLVRSGYATRPHVQQYEHSLLSGITGNPDSHFRTVYRVAVRFLDDSQERTASLILKHYCSEHSQETGIRPPWLSFRREARLQACLGSAMSDFVARLYYHDMERCHVWMEDVGDESFYAQWSSSGPKRRHRLIESLTKTLAHFHVRGPSLLLGSFEVVRPTEEDYLREMLDGVGSLQEFAGSALPASELAAAELCLRRLAASLATRSNSLVHGDLDPDVNVRLTCGDVPKLIDLGNTGRWRQARSPGIPDAVWLQPAETDFGGIAHYLGQAQTELFVESYLRHRGPLSDDTPTKESFVQFQRGPLPIAHALMRAGRYAHESRRSDTFFAERLAPMYDGYMKGLLDCLERAARGAPDLSPVYALIGVLKTAALKKR